MSPIRIQLSRRKGWHMPTNTVKVDRSTRFGNPNLHEDAALVVEAFRGLMTRDYSIVRGLRCAGFAVARERAEVLQRAVTALRGKNVACWCAFDQPRHADVELALANPSIRGE